MALEASKGNVAYWKFEGGVGAVVPASASVRNEDGDSPSVGEKAVGIRWFACCCTGENEDGECPLRL